MNFEEVKIENGSHLASKFMISNDGTILWAKYSGQYGKGSSGNIDGIFMFSMLAAYYFAYEPIAIILDIESVYYQWGNTIADALSFFSIIGRDEDEIRKKIYIIVSSKNKNAVDSLEGILIGKNRIYCQNFNEAIELAQIEVQDYLK